MDFLTVVDVKLGIGIGSTSGFECNGDKVFAEDIGKDRRSQGAIFIEDLVDNILGTGQ